MNIDNFEVECVDSIDIYKGELAIGCGVYGNGTGGVFVYTFDENKENFVLTDEINHPEIGEAHFGDSLSLNQDTLAVGAPQHANGRGTVFVFVRRSSGLFTEYMQVEVSELKENDAYGKSV
eukprot:UN34145